MRFRNLIFWFFVVITILFTGFWTFVAFDEWLTVGFHRKTAGYPWGPVNQNPWYYKNPSVFSRVMLIEFLLLAAGLGFAIYRIIQRKKQSILYCMLSLWFLMMLMLINAFM